MTRTALLAEAISHRDAARKAMEARTTWNQAKRDAAEELEFWSNKVAFLQNEEGWA